MIALPAGTNIWIAAGVTDLRRGFTGLSAVAQTVIELSPMKHLVGVDSMSAREPGLPPEVAYSPGMWYARQGSNL